MVVVAVGNRGRVDSAWRRGKFVHFVAVAVLLDAGRSCTN